MPDRLLRWHGSDGGSALAVRFGLVGVLKTAVDFGTFNVLALLMNDLTLAGALFANSVAFGAALTVGYLLHASYAFRMRPGEGSITRYAAVSIGAFVVYSGGFAILLGLAHHPSSTLVVNGLKLAALATAWACNFAGYRYLAFRRPLEERPAG